MLGLEVDNGDVAVDASVEPGSVVDGIIALLNAFGFRGVGVAIPPQGVLPAANVDVSATGSVTAGATVSSCPADSICFWDKPKFAGQKVVMRSPYAETGGDCVNLPEGFHPASVINHLRGDRMVAHPRPEGAGVVFLIGLQLERCHPNMPAGDVRVGPDDSRAELHPSPPVVAYDDHARLVSDESADESEF